MKIKDRNREDFLRTYQKGEREKIKDILEKAFQKKKQRNYGKVMLKIDGKNCGKMQYQLFIVNTVK